jgi:hypothetical protein
MKGIRVGILCALAAVATASPAGCGRSAEDTTAVPISPGDPRGIVEEATLDGIHSGHLDGLLNVSNRSGGDAIRMGFFATFNGLEEEGSPQFLLSLKSQGTMGGRSVDFNGSLGFHPSKAQFIYGPSYREYPYDFDNATFQELRSKFEAAQQEEGEGDVEACLQDADGLELARLVRNLDSQGRRKNPDGVPVFLVSGEIDVSAFVDLIVRLAQEPTCGSQMRALGIASAPELEASLAGLSRRVTRAEVTLAIDKKGFLHDLVVHAAWKNLQGESLDLDFAFLLREIDEPIDVPLMADGRPLDELLRKFGSSQAAALDAGGAKVVIGFLEGIAGGMTGRLPSPAPIEESRGDSGS